MQRSPLHQPNNNKQINEATTTDNETSDGQIKKSIGAYRLSKEKRIMHQCFFYFHTGLIHRTKIVLANSAKWTNPIFWKIFKCCTWLYAILWVADSWVIHPTADITYIFLHSHIVLIVICCKYTHYTSNDKAKRVKVVLIYNNYNSVCYLWETFLCKKLLCVPWVLWEYSSPTDCTDQHRWLVALVRPRNPQNSQKFGCVSGCVGMAGCHTLLHLCKSVLSVGDYSLQEASVGSVRSVGIQFSHGLH